MSKLSITLFLAAMFLPSVVIGQQCVKFDGIAPGTKFGSGYNSPGDIIHT